MKSGLTGLAGHVIQVLFYNVQNLFKQGSTIYAVTFQPGVHVVQSGSAQAPSGHGGGASFTLYTQ